VDKEYLYEIINGSYRMDMIDLPEGMEVENEFAEGTECMKMDCEK
jgi:hypothetical protein